MGKTLATSKRTGTAGVVVVKDCQLTGLGAVFSRELCYQDWTKAGRELCKISGASLWWIGDWINAGAEMYGEKYKAALELTEFDYGTLMNISSVCRAITISRRRENLSFYFHAEVAGLDAEGQEKFLALAEENDWTRSDLRQAIRKAHATEADGKQPGTALRFVLSKAVGDCVRWFRVQLEDTPIDDMPAQRRDALRRELKPLVDIYNALERNTTPRKESIKGSNSNR